MTAPAAIDAVALRVAIDTLRNAAEALTIAAANASTDASVRLYASAAGECIDVAKALAQGYVEGA